MKGMDRPVSWCVNNSKQLRKQILFTALQYGRQNAIDTAPVPTKFIELLKSFEMWLIGLD